MRHTIIALFAALPGLAAPALAQPDPSGINFVTIGNPNNPAYHGPDPENRVTGRGSVGYEYRLSQTEVTTGQWLEFLNAALARPDPIEWVGTPPLWGAARDPTYNGPGIRFRLGSSSIAASLGVYGISWRTAAVYCNWLSNGKSFERTSFLTGAYDVSTFGTNPDQTFTDQTTHSPGATYWIPTLDEWLKGAHYDPTHAANDGWWLYANRKDRAPVYGPPVTFGGNGTGEANAGFLLSGSRQYDIPLGSYPTQTSYYGLLDTAGAGGEWTEEIRRLQFSGWSRVYDGSYTGLSGSGAAAADLVNAYSDDYPSSLATSAGLRLASSIPAPLPMSIVCTGLGVAFFRRRRMP